MSTPDYRRLATIIREQNPAPRGDDDYITGTRRHTMRDVADAYDTLADDLEAESKLIDVTNYGSTEHEYVSADGKHASTSPFPDVTYDTHDAASISVEVNCGACGTYLGEQYKRGDGITLYKAHIEECEATRR